MKFFLLEEIPAATSGLTVVVPAAESCLAINAIGLVLAGPAWLTGVAVVAVIIVGFAFASLAYRSFRERSSASREL